MEDFIVIVAVFDFFIKIYIESKLIDITECRSKLWVHSDFTYELKYVFVEKFSRR